MVLFSAAYHHGFNFGYNIAEAVNFGTKTWLNITIPKADHNFKMERY